MVRFVHLMSKLKGNRFFLSLCNVDQLCVMLHACIFICLRNKQIGFCTCFWANFSIGNPWHRECYFIKFFVYVIRYEISGIWTSAPKYLSFLISPMIYTLFLFKLVRDFGEHWFCGERNGQCCFQNLPAWERSGCFSDGHIRCCEGS